MLAGTQTAPTFYDTGQFGGYLGNAHYQCALLLCETREGEFEVHGEEALHGPVDHDFTAQDVALPDQRLGVSDGLLVGFQQHCEVADRTLRHYRINDRKL